MNTTDEMMRYATLEMQESYERVMENYKSTDLNGLIFQTGLANCYCKELYRVHGNGVEFIN